MNLLWFLIIGLAAGWLAGQVMRGGGFGLVGDLVVGVIGAFIGGTVLSLFKITIGGPWGPFVTAFIGAVLLILLLRVIKRA